MPWLKMPGGGWAHVRMSGRRRDREFRRCLCGALAEYQCDHRERARDRFKGGTRMKRCDAWVCEKCVREIGPDRHLCAAHQAQGSLAL